MHVYEYTYTRRRVAEVPARIGNPRDVAPVLHRMLADRETEALVVLALNTRNHIVGASTVYTGSVNASLVRVGELFRDPIRWNAAGIILAHNHPSGETNPSPDDLHLTSEALKAGRILDIDVLDHVIVGDGGGWYSIREAGHIAFDRAGGAA